MFVLYNMIGADGSLPLRLFDCFLLVMPVVSNAFGAFLAADSAGRAVFFTAVGIFGSDSDAFKAKEGDEMVTVSAICHDRAMRYVGAPAWSVLRRQSSFLLTGRRGESSKLCDGSGEMVAI
jgi:hypothetical protein